MAVARTQATLEEVRFRHARLGTVGVELLGLDQFRQRVSQAHLSRPQRVEFFMLLLLNKGYLRHSVDFSEWRLGAGSLVCVRPGQVQQWFVDERASGTMVLIDPSALAPLAAASGRQDALLWALENWPAAVRLDDGFAAECASAIEGLARDVAAFDGSADDVLFVRQQLLGLLLRVERWHRKRLHAAGTASAQTHEVYRLFRAELERQLRYPATVTALARRLGYSESTLNRACLASAGHTAKVLIDRRLAMEAARILGYSTDSVTDVAHGLGFSEPTNFIRFFQRMVGSTPQRFRQQFKPAVR